VNRQNAKTPKRQKKRAERFWVCAGRRGRRETPRRTKFVEPAGAQSHCAHSGKRTHTPTQFADSTTPSSRGAETPIAFFWRFGVLAVERREPLRDF